MSNKSTTIADLLSRNKEIAKTWKPQPLFSEFSKLGYPPPKLLVITCGDPRSVPEDFLGLKNYEAAVCRNLCGHVRNEMNAILALDSLMRFDEIMIVHHSDCGGFMIKDDEVRKTLKERTPEHAAEVDKYEDFCGITDLAQSVKDDIAVLKASPLMRKELAEATRGFMFDIQTGLLTPVEA